MTQKVVIEVTMNGQKCRSKAMKIAAGFPGVDSAALGGQGQSQIEVTGDGVDAVELTILLRKKLGYAEIRSVGKKEGENKPDPPKPEPPVSSWVGSVPYYYEPPPYYYQYCYCEPSPCSIL